MVTIYSSTGLGNQVAKILYSITYMGDPNVIFLSMEKKNDATFI